MLLRVHKKEAFSLTRRSRRHHRRIEAHIAVRLHEKRSSIVAIL